MSSVNSSDSTGRDDSVRRTREDHRKKESEMVRKHQKEIRRLNEEHYKDMEKLREQHESTMSKLQKLSHETVTEKDMKYRREIEDLRSMHRKQLQDVVEESNKNQTLTRETTRREKQTLMNQQASHVKHLNEEHTGEMQGQTERYLDNIGEIKKAQRDAIESNRKHLNQKHENELNILRDDREREVDNLQGSYESYRRTAEQKDRDYKMQMVQSREKSSDELLRAVQAERKNSQGRDDMLRNDMQHALSKNHDDYEKALNRDRQQLDQIREEVETDVARRITSRAERIEAENQLLKLENARNNIGVQNDAKRQINNLKESLTKNIDNYRQQRDEAVRLANKHTAKEITQLTDRHNAQVQDMNRDYQDKFELQDRINRNALQSISTDLSARNQQQKVLTETRVKGLIEQTEEQKQRLIEQNLAGHQAMRRAQVSELQSLREKVDQEKLESVERIKEQMRKQEAAHTEKVSNLMQKYERQIAQLNDQLLRERRNNNEHLRRTVHDMTRKGQADLDTQSLQYKSKLAEAQDHHTEEIRNLNKNHQEQMDQLISTLKKT